MKKKRFILGVSVILVCIAAGLLLFKRDAPSGSMLHSADSSPRKPGHQGGSRDAVSALGRIQPGDGVLKISAARQERVRELKVKEGQFVKEGDIIAYLECHPERLAELDHARAQLKEARDRQHDEEVHAQALMAEAEARLRKVEIAGPLGIEDQKSKVRLFEAELKSAQQDMERMKDLYRKGLIAKQEYEHQELKAQTLHEEVSSARSVLSKLVGEHNEALNEASAQLRSAQAKLNLVRSSMNIMSLEKNMEVAQARVRDCIIKAPVQGRILKIFTWPGEAINEDPILQMGEERMYVTAEVYETDIRLLRVGQKVRITSQALPKELTGKVEQIGLTVFKNRVVGIDPAAATDLRIIEVKIRLDEDSIPARYNNLQVDVFFDLRS